MKMDFTKKALKTLFTSTIILSAVASPVAAFAQDYDTLINDTQVSIDALSAQQANLYAELAVGYEALSALKAEAEQLLTSISEDDNEIAALTTQISELETLIAKREQLLADQARAVQANGATTDYLNIIASSESISDFVGRLDIVRKMVSSNKDLLATQIADKEAVELKQQAVEAAKSEKIEKQIELEQLKATLETQQAANEEVYTALTTDLTLAAEHRDALVAEKVQFEQQALIAATQTITIEQPAVTEVPVEAVVPVETEAAEVAPIEVPAEVVVPTETEAVEVTSEAPIAVETTVAVPVETIAVEEVAPIEEAVTTEAIVYEETTSVEAPAVEETTAVEVYEAPIAEETTAVEVYEAPIVEETTAVEVYEEPIVEETTAVEVYEEPIVEETAPILSTGSVDALLSNAAQFVGTPYVWGGKGPAGFDCSGFVQYVYMQTYGIDVGGWTGAQESAGTRISVEEAQPGDLYFWGEPGGTYHVAIATGGGGYIHASQPGTPLGYGSVNAYFMPSFAIRVN